MKFWLKSHDIAADPNSRQKGFTLIELMIVIAILGVLGWSIYSMFQNITMKSTAQRTTAITQQKARLTLEMMARDIRMMALDPKNTAGAGLWSKNGSNTDTLTANYMAFSADLNYDGDIEDEYERIAYFINGDGDLVMETFIDGVTGSTELVMLSGLRPNDLAFRYFDSNNDEMTLSAAMAGLGRNLFAVEITLTLRTDSVGGPIERAYSTIVKIRNRNS